MHPWRLSITLCILATYVAGAAVVYKWTDAAGVVHYSDQPVSGAEKMTTSSAATNGIGGESAPKTSTEPVKGQSGPLDYTVFSIESPAKEQVFFGDETVPIRLHLEPGLKPGQRIVWHLNGRALEDQAPDAISFSLETLPRGTYAVDATVMDAESGESRTAENVTFYVRQPSELSPQHKKS